MTAMNHTLEKLKHQVAFNEADRERKLGDLRAAVAVGADLTPNDVLGKLAALKADPTEFIADVEAFVDTPEYRAHPVVREVENARVRAEANRLNGVISRCVTNSQRAEDLAARTGNDSQRREALADARKYDARAAALRAERDALLDTV